MSTLLSQLQRLGVQLLEQRLATRVLITVVILGAGYVAGKLSGRLVQYLWERRLQGQGMVEKVRQRGRSPARGVEYIVLVVTLMVAMVYINAAAATEMVAGITSFTPKVITAVLVFLLGVILANGFVLALRWVVDSFGVMQQAGEIGASQKVISAFLTALKLFLYLVVIELAIIQLGASPAIIDNTLTAASYGVVVLLAAIGFYGFRDLVKNYAAGIYLRHSDVIEPGKRVKIDGETGEIRDVRTFSTTVDTDSGYFLLAPNAEMMTENVLFKRVKAEVDTLEDIKDYFVTEESPYQGAASAEMALAMFGFDTTQGDISEEVGEANGLNRLSQVIEQLTEQEVRTAVVDADKVTDLGAEFKVWFNNESLIIPYFNKDVLFPGTEETHYVLCVGVEGDELLLVDPTTGETGGVYYVNSSDLMRAMENMDGGGYLVLAPRGTTAFWRMKNDLIYSNLSLYKQLSKSLEVQLNKILRRGEVLKHIVPPPVEDFIENWRDREQQVTRMWAPKAGDKKLDEFTDNNG